MTLEAWAGNYPARLFSHDYRRAQEGYPTTLAMHWDGTYRDRCDPGTTWEGEWDNDRLLSAYKIAKHLAPK